MRFIAQPLSPEPEICYPALATNHSLLAMKRDALTINTIHVLSFLYKNLTEGKTTSTEYTILSYDYGEIPSRSKDQKIE